MLNIDNSYKEFVSLFCMKRLWGFFVFIFLLVNVNSLILIDDDFDNKYSLGDRVLLNYSVIVEDSYSGFLETFLVCDDEKNLVDKRFVFLEDESRNYEVEFLLNNEGDCVFEVEFLEDEARTEKFEISSEVLIEYSLNGKNFFPGEEILIEGSCKKFNSEDCKGIVRFSFGEDYEKDYFLDSGDFSVSYQLKDDFKSGIYSFSLENIERNLDGKTLSYGKKEDFVFVKSIAQSIFIEGNSEVVPGRNSTFFIRILDQSGEFMGNKTFFVKLTDSNNEIFYQGELLSGENITFDFPYDFVRGTAHLSAFYGDIGESISLYVEDFERINFSIVGNSVVFENVGNVFYRGIQKYEMVSGNETIEEFINLSLDVGESFLVPLEYSGVYNITFDDKSFFGVPLTGAAISINDDFDYRDLLGGVLLLIVLGLSYYFVKKKLLNKKKSDVGEIKVGVESKKDNKKRILVKDVEKKDENLKNNVYMAFFKVDSEILDYEKVCLNYGFKLHKVNSKMGYVVFYENGNSLFDDKFFKFGCSLYNFSKSKGNNLSLVLNKGYFEKKLSLFKKFALINKSIMDDLLGKFIIGDKLMKGLYVSSKKEIIVDIKSRKMRVWEVLL